MSCLILYASEEHTSLLQPLLQSDVNSERFPSNSPNASPSELSTIPEGTRVREVSTVSRSRRPRLRVILPTRPHTVGHRRARSAGERGSLSDGARIAYIPETAIASSTEVPTCEDTQRRDQRRRSVPFLSGISWGSPVIMDERRLDQRRCSVPPEGVEPLPVSDAMYTHSLTARDLESQNLITHWTNRTSSSPNDFRRIRFLIGEAQRRYEELREQYLQRFESLQRQNTQRYEELQEQTAQQRIRHRCQLVISGLTIISLLTGLTITLLQLAGN